MRRRRRDRAAGLAEAQAAVARAQDAQREAVQRRPEVHAVAERLRQLRHENHFAESISEAFRGGT